MPQLFRSLVLVRTGRSVMGDMFGVRHQLQVLHLIVYRVVVAVVDTVPLGYGPVVVLLDHSVEDPPVFRKIPFAQPAIVAAPRVNNDFHLLSLITVLL